MKYAAALALLLLMPDLYAKTCKALLSGKLKETEVSITDPHVFYPKDPYHSEIAKWGCFSQASCQFSSETP